MAAEQSSSTLELYRLVRRIEKVLLGPTAQTPTPTILKVFDVGILYFLNEKQSVIHRMLGEAPRNALEVLPPLRSLLEFTSYLVSTLIVEAERIDAAVLQTRSELSELASELRRCDLELQFRKRHIGSTVVQTIAHHYNTRIVVPERRIHAASDQMTPSQQTELADQTATISNLRDAVKTRKNQLKALTVVQRLLHGKEGVPAIEASAIVADTGVLVAFRKCSHRIKDAIFDLPQRDGVPAINAVLDFITYLDCGMTAAIDDLESCEMALKRDAVAAERDERLVRLTHHDQRNKQLSTSAVRHNEALSRAVLGGGFDHSSVASSSRTASQQHSTYSAPPLPAAFMEAAVPPATSTAQPTLRSAIANKSSAVAGSSDWVAPRAAVADSGSDMGQLLSYYCS